MLRARCSGPGRQRPSLGRRVLRVSTVSIAGKGRGRVPTVGALTESSLAALSVCSLHLAGSSLAPCGAMSAVWSGCACGGANQGLSLLEGASAEARVRTWQQGDVDEATPAWEQVATGAVGSIS